MPRSSASLKSSRNSKKKASSTSVLAAVTSMSSRIIRGDGRMQKLTVSTASSTGMSETVSQDHIMQVEKTAFEQGYAEGERIGKQMGEAMVETICKRYEKSLAQLAGSHKQMAQNMEEETVRL